VRFNGWVEHQVVQQHLRACHVFGFPSVREFGGGAVAEAMALGLVPIVTDFGGPGELASPESSFVLPLGERAQIVASLREVLEGIVRDPGPLSTMGERARRRVLELFTWPAKALQTRQVYDWVLGRRSKPDFGMPLADPA
jgi:glycosyltransferase involved in cell wall biosynthesis